MIIMLSRIKSYPDEPLEMGRQALELRDWCFGASSRRRLLEVVVGGERSTWSYTELARSSGLHVKGSVDEYLDALTQLGLLERAGGVYRPVRESPLYEPVRALLTALAEVSEGPVPSAR